MSAILQHARKHYFKGAYAQTLFGDLSAIGGVPTFDAYGVQVPKLDTMLFPFALSREQEETMKRLIPHLLSGMTLEEDQEDGKGEMIVRSNGFLRKRRHLLLANEGQKLKLTLLSDKEESLLDTLLRESVIGEALIEFWINSGFFKRRNLDDFDKQLVVEAALEEHSDNTSRRQVTAEDAAKELEKARKLLLEITPKALPRERAKNS